MSDRPRWPDPVSGPCRNCTTRPATAWWVGEGGIMAANRGMASPWCERCCVEAQLEHARKMAASIPELERKLSSLP